MSKRALDVINGVHWDSAELIAQRVHFGCTSFPWNIVDAELAGITLHLGVRLIAESAVQQARAMFHGEIENVGASAAFGSISIQGLNREKIERDAHTGVRRQVGQLEFYLIGGELAEKSALAVGSGAGRLIRPDLGCAFGEIGGVNKARLGGWSGIESSGRGGIEREQQEKSSE